MERERQTMLDFRSFDPRFKSGLIFSIFEGILHGKTFKLICDQDPSMLQKQFSEAKVKNIQWQINKISESIWEVEIIKTPS